MDMKKNVRDMAKDFLLRNSRLTSDWLLLACKTSQTDHLPASPLKHARIATTVKIQWKYSQRKNVLTLSPTTPFA